MKMTVYKATKNRQEHWNLWYAWHPVFAEGMDGNKKLIWLEWVERKEYLNYGGWSWRHRETETSHSVNADG